MARGGFLQALGNLWRWTIWGFAAVFVVVLAYGWSNRDAGEEIAVVDDKVIVEDVPDMDVEIEATGDVSGEADVSDEAVLNTVAEVQSAIESAVGENSDAGQTIPEFAQPVEPSEDEEQAVREGAPETDTEVVATAEGVVDQESSDLNILSPELSDVTVPGDDGSYSVVSLFRRDDGTIEVVSDRTENGETEQTIRLVTCAPLAVGIVSEGDGPRNEAPDLERIPLGTAAATIAALACGAMN